MGQSDLMSDYDWDSPQPEQFQESRQRALAILRETDTPKSLAKFYNPENNWAGLEFHELAPVTPYEIGPSDLLAITLMDVAVQPAALRRLLLPGADRDRIAYALRRVRPNVTLADADHDTIDAAAELYQEVKAALRGNRWVTASKICARMRPALIPVRDRVVVAQLNLPNNDYRADWTLIRGLARDPDVRTALTDLAKEASSPANDLRRLPALRVLDTAVWMHGRGSHPAQDREIDEE
jgi:hypothetical protein